MPKNSLYFSFNKLWAAALLFISSCTFLFVLPVMNNMPVWVFRLCMSAVLLFSILSLEKVKLYFVLVGFIAAILDWFSDMGQYSAIGPLLKTVTFVFVFLVVGSLMIKFLKQKEVGLYSLLEAINGYLLLGILFSSITVMLFTLSPESYQSSHGNIVRNDLFYYAMITLTTTGYGDVLPVTAAAKNLAMIIAVCGQIYVAFLVGVLVGKYTNKLTHE
ncbi:MAG: two pore domain potassium channel family protein [Bacteroidia bacterium]|nr:two pore domain potassium channel family protein [Bacteroidia bacterium]